MSLGRENRITTCDCMADSRQDSLARKNLLAIFSSQDTYSLDFLFIHLYFLQFFLQKYIMVRSFSVFSFFQISMGVSINYVDRILKNFDPSPPHVLTSLLRKLMKYRWILRDPPPSLPPSLLLVNIVYECPILILKKINDKWLIIHSYFL